MKIFVIGHKSPDLDCVSSAVEYAEFLEKSKRYENAEIVPLRAGEPNKETVYIFEKYQTKMPGKIEDAKIEDSDAFVLVDHNEESQRHDLVRNEQITEIVDHHKLNINFTGPIRVDAKPLGSTSSIIYEYFNLYGIKPSKEASVLILASILSDTVGLKGPTTTGLDSTIARDIAENLKVDLADFTFELFKAKSDLSGLSPLEIVKKDFKVFDFAGKKVFIGQVETVEPHKVLENKTDLIGALEQVKVDEGAGIAYLFITDILNLNSQAIYATDEEGEVLAKAFMGEGRDNVIDVGPKVSRKKDLAPAVEKALTE